ncbi:MAG TPA: ABC transporter ATP-binding protein [Candidatus Saccharimonadales bacterium]|nr:ABC transporter ATP-binding protein [Candidatus Saccharimonadales bacterium]
MTPVVDVRHLTVVLGGRFTALQTVDLQIKPGVITGFIGPSGAGKTTLIRTIVGRQRLTSGSVRVFGKPAGSAGLRSRISYMTQEQAVYGDLTVRENLQYFATMVGLRRGHARHMVGDVLDTVHLTDKGGVLVRDLSGGQRQRVSLAVALLGNPELLVLDEPSVGLDPVLREQLWEVFHELTQNGRTVIISSHVMDEAERCDDLVLIRDGEVVAHDTPAALRSKTDSPSVEAAFLKLAGGTP